MGGGLRPSGTSRGAKSPRVSQTFSAVAASASPATSHRRRERVGFLLRAANADVGSCDFASERHLARANQFAARFLVGPGGLDGATDPAEQVGLIAQPQIRRAKAGNWQRLRQKEGFA